MTDNNLGSEQDELYYFAKNFNKLKFSNQAYIDSTQKQKEDNEKEIEKLKKDYEKLKNDVAMLKKTCLYVPGRAKSVSNSEYTFYRLKYDQARCEKLKSIEEWKKNSEKYNELKNEAKLINDDNNPYVKRIKLLENKLDKAMIKYNEAMSIRRTYEQILARLKEERAGYDNQIAAIQKSLKAKGHDLNEFKLLLQDSKQARNYSELLLKNTQLSKEAFEEHFEQLIQAHRRENQKEIQREKIEERNRKKNNAEREPTISDEKNYNVRDNNLEQKVKELEEADKYVRETTGADDINEICQKFSNLRETKENLKNEKKELEKMCSKLSKKKQELSEELNKLKYSSQEDITRKEIEDHELQAEKILNSCQQTRLKLRKQEKLAVDINSGIATLLNILNNKLFEDIYKDENLKLDDDTNLKQIYLNLIQSSKEEKIDVKQALDKMNILFRPLEEKCNDIKNRYNFIEDDNKLDRKEENYIENIYIDHDVESNQNSEYGPEEDIEPDIPNKESLKRNDFNGSLRPFSAMNGTMKNRISINAKNKNY